MTDDIAATAPPAGVASDNHPSRNQSAGMSAAVAEPKKRVSRRRKGAEAEQDLAADFAAAAYPVDAPHPDLLPSDAGVTPDCASGEAAIGLVLAAIQDEPGHAAPLMTHQDFADEIEAEKVWTLAGVIRAANTAWGVDEGLDADVREARALMAEARRQVRENAPIGAHYRADDPDLRSVA